MVSIIIVYYHTKQVLYDCLESIKLNSPRTAIEVIVVDNDEEIQIKTELKRRFPWVKYIKSPGNIGFGSGNNLGAKHAKGEYFFFLNPDTEIFSRTVDELVSFIKQRPDVGIVAPLLLHQDHTPFPQQGCSLLTPLKGIVALSFINKVFPLNPISQRFWLHGWDKTKVKEVDVVPGTAFLIRKQLYNDVNGFDEHFFLYFEEFDLCKRIKEKGSKLFIIPKARIIHLWGKGGTNLESKSHIRKFINQSRFYYFKKHYGVANALTVEAFARFGKKNLPHVLTIAAYCLLFILIALYLHTVLK